MAISCAVEAALRLTGDCIQVHEALGFVRESDAHLDLKRARRLAAPLGNSQSARRAIGDLLAAVASGGAGELFPPLGAITPAGT